MGQYESEGGQRGAFNILIGKRSGHVSIKIKMPEAKNVNNMFHHHLLTK
jgi:hypothetical protein